MNALAGLMSPADVGNSVQRAAVSGMETGRKMRLRKAMASVAANPNDEAAIRTVTELDPERGAKLIEQRQAHQFNNAAADYYQGSQNALARPPGARGPSPMAPGAPQLNALAPRPPVAPGASFDQAFAPMADPARQAAQQAPQAQQPGAPVPAQAEQQGPDLSVLGQPEGPRDDSFLRMLKLDAKAAFAIDSSMRDRAADRLKLQRDAYGMAVSRLGAVTDDASYQAAMADIAQTIEPLGVEVTDHLPEQFPGPDGLKQLRLGALDAKDQLTQFMREADIEADNSRLDRNTDSLIDDRRARRGEYVRHNQATEGNTRRGQDLRPQGRGVRSGGSPRENLPVVSSPEEARKLPSGTRFKIKGTNQVKVVP